jgi:putative FmdB family regulatory protein
VPIYDYVCASCGTRIEVLHGVHAPGPDRCEHCGQGPMRKLLTPPTIHFKGTGWAKKERTASRARGRSSDDGAPAEKSSKASEGSSGPEKAAADDSGSAASGSAASGSAAPGMPAPGTPGANASSAGPSRD